MISKVTNENGYMINSTVHTLDDIGYRGIGDWCPKCLKSLTDLINVLKECIFVHILAYYAIKRPEGGKAAYVLCNVIKMIK